jgi:hypothetical protein
VCYALSIILAMQLLTLSEVPASKETRVFRYSIVRPAAVALIIIGASGALAYTEIVGHAGPAYYIACYVAAVVLICLVLMRRILLARLRVTNWLAETAKDGVFLQFRSYLNYHLPADDLTIVFIPYSDIRSARLVRERAKIPDEDGFLCEYRRLVELELAGDLATLSKSLATESMKRGPQEKTWYGTTSTLYHHYPVQITAAPFLQIEWAVVPGATSFLEALRPYTAIAPPVFVAEDLANFAGLSPQDQEKRLRELDRRGRTIAATYMARRIHGFDLAQAQAYVKGLRSTQ